MTVRRLAACLVAAGIAWPAAAELIVIESPISSAWPDVHFAWDPFGASAVHGSSNKTSPALPFGAQIDLGGASAEKVADSDYQFVRTHGASVNAAWLPAGTPVDESQDYIDIGMGMFCELEPSEGSCGLEPSVGSTFYVGYRVVNPAGLEPGTYYGWAEFVRSQADPNATTLTRRAWNDTPGAGVVTPAPEPALDWTGAGVAIATCAALARRRCS